MELKRVRLSDPEAQPLLVGLTGEYDSRYGENVEMTRTKEGEFDPPDGLFVVLMDGPLTTSGEACVGTTTTPVR